MCDFCFFKQKTAYEMRISDWSSDVCSSDLIEKDITPFRLMEALNAKMRPLPVAVIDCKSVAGDWHARFSCIRRSYVYRIVNRRAPLAIEAGRAWRVGQELDVHAMHAAARSEEHTSELQTLMRTSYAVFFLKTKKETTSNRPTHISTMYPKPLKPTTRTSD